MIIIEHSTCGFANLPSVTEAALDSCGGNAHYGDPGHVLLGGADEDWSERSDEGASKR